MKSARLAAMLMTVIASAVWAQAPPESSQVAAEVDNDASATQASNNEVEVPNRWLLLCCGLPGDAGHRQRLTEACEKIIATAEPVIGVPPEQLLVLAGDDEMRDALSGQASDVGVCTAESVAAAMQRLSDTVGADDACWVMLLGHAHLYDARSQFNVLDADFDQSHFADWAKSLACREQVFWLTMPISGFWIKPLSSPTRVIISATEADLEFTGTEMPYALADLLSGDGQDQTLRDVDQDGSLSLLDLYLATNLEITGRFRSIDRLQTEHAQLEDNGDGRGSEVQGPYLPVEVGEDEEADPDEEVDAEEDDSADQDAAEAAESTLPDPITSKSLDGYRSRHILLKLANH